MSRVRAIRVTVLVTHADGVAVHEEVDLLRDPGDPAEEAPPAMGVRILDGPLAGTTIMVADAWLAEARRGDEPLRLAKASRTSQREP